MVKYIKMSKVRKMLSIVEKKEEKGDKDNILVGASVIAAMAYQAAISPPGGVSALDAVTNLPPSAQDADSYKLQPGASLLAFFYYNLSNTFWVFNTMSLLGALSVILIYISGSSRLKQKIVVWPIRLIMCISLLSMTGAYACAILATTPKSTNISNINNTRKGIVVAIIVYVAIVVVLLMSLVVKFIRYMVGEMRNKNVRGEAAAEETDTEIA
ncbi:hypothetical protein ACET3Z_029720 [Daucus carota]